MRVTIYHNPRYSESIQVKYWQLMRTGESVHREHRVEVPCLSRTQPMEVMLEQPVPIQHLIVVAGGQTRIGYPLEDVLELL